MRKYTPMMEQYLSVKAQAQDALLFFRLGDFYEMFFEDAVLASRELEITLTGRDAGAEERVPMCGVPVHSAEVYINKLIEKGYKVAICEQMEDPAAAKGVVRREIVRIVTPGTVMSDKAVAEKANNYLAAVAEHGGRWAVAACDLTTGELYAVSTGSIDEAADELNVYAVTEVVGSELVIKRLKAHFNDRWRNTAYTVRDPSGYDAGKLSETYPRISFEGLRMEHREAVALLLSYLSETQKRSLLHIRSVNVYEPTVYMTLDPFTRKNLELTETVRDRSRKGSLLWLLDKTVTAAGGRLLKRWLDKPLMSGEAIRERLDAVETLHGDVLLREELRELLKRVYDIERLAGRIAYGSANGKDLLALASSLSVVPDVMDLLKDASPRMLAEIGNDPDTGQDIRMWIEEAVHPDPPVTIRDGGIIRDGYHERLDKLREASKNGKQWIAELEQAEREATGIKSLKIGYNKVFGYYIEITRANLHMIPEGRYERKQTLAGSERFVTPELKEKEALILEAEEKMAELEYGLFIELRERIAKEIPRLQKLADRLAALDVLQALATVAAENRYVRPDVHEGFELEIEDGRHPVVEEVLPSGTFIANGTQFHPDGTRVLLITGPNMAGKSTYMRQVALISIMAQIGSFVPAKRAKLPVIDRVFTRIGAADDLTGGQSTFMVEMQDIQTMIAKASERSLVIIDELGRGTSTGEGMAIAQAVIEHLHHKIRCKTLVSTHYHELAHLEKSLEYLTNACMAVKESGGQVTFLRKLVPGAADSSYGIYCAQLAGLPSSVIDRAYALLHEFEARAASVAERESAAAAAVERESGAGTKAAEEQAESEEPLQLSFFAEPMEREQPQRDRKAEEILQLLNQMDLMKMTPLDAMNFLFELKQKAQESTQTIGSK